VSFGRSCVGSLFDGEGGGWQVWFGSLLIWTHSCFQDAQDSFKDEDRYDAEETWQEGGGWR